MYPRVIPVMFCYYDRVLLAVQHSTYLGKKLFFILFNQRNCSRTSFKYQDQPETKCAWCSFHSCEQRHKQQYWDIISARRPSSPPFKIKACIWNFITWIRFFLEFSNKRPKRWVDSLCTFDFKHLNALITLDWIKSLSSIINHDGGKRPLIIMQVHTICCSFILKVTELNSHIQ